MAILEHDCHETDLFRHLGHSAQLTYSANERSCAISQQLPIVTRFVSPTVFENRFTQFRWPLTLKSISNSQMCRSMALASLVGRPQLSEVCTWNHLSISNHSHLIRLWMEIEKPYSEGILGVSGVKHPYFCIPCISYRKRDHPCTKPRILTYCAPKSAASFWKKSHSTLPVTYGFEKWVKGQSKVNGITIVGLAILYLVGFALGITFLSLTVLTSFDCEFNMENSIPEAILGILGTKHPQIWLTRLVRNV